MDIEQFATRSDANDGVKVPLYNKHGEKTEHWLIVRGVDSDAFREAESEAKRMVATKKATLKEAMRHALSSLVSEWSLDGPCTKENIIHLLTEAPQIADAIDKIAGDRKSFFLLKSSSLESTQEQKSGSRKSPKARQTPSKNTSKASGDKPEESQKS